MEMEDFECTGSVAIAPRRCSPRERLAVPATPEAIAAGGDHPRLSPHEPLLRVCSGDQGDHHREWRSGQIIDDEAILQGASELAEDGAHGAAGKAALTEPSSNRAQSEFTGEYKKTIGTDFMRKEIYLDSVGEEVRSATDDRGPWCVRRSAWSHCAGCWDSGEPSHLGHCGTGGVLKADAELLRGSQSVRDCLFHHRPGFVPRGA